MCLSGCTTCETAFKGPTLDAVLFLGVCIPLPGSYQGVNALKIA